MKSSYRTPDGKAQIDWELKEKEPGKFTFSATGGYDGGSGQCLDSIGKAYPEDETVQALVRIWSLYHLNEPIPAEVVAELKAIAAKAEPVGSFYDHQAETFLKAHGLTLRATLADGKPAPWSEGESGHHYRVTISREGGGRLTFDFWGSIADAKAGKKTLRAYAVLACISGDLYTPETLEEFCAEYGGDTDSIKTRQTFNRANRFAKNLRAFFTDKEQTELAEIQ